MSTEAKRPIYIWRERLKNFNRCGGTLKPSTVALAFIIGEYANSTTLECWPGEDRLAGDLGVSASTVRRAKAELIGAGVIEERAPGSRSGQRAAVLALTPERMVGGGSRGKGLSERTGAPNGGHQCSQVESSSDTPTSYGTSHRTSDPGLTVGASVASLPPSGGGEVEMGKKSDDLLPTDPGPLAAAIPEGAKPPDGRDRHNVVMPGWTPPTRAEPPAPPARRTRYFRHEG